MLNWLTMSSTSAVDGLPEDGVLSDGGDGVALFADGDGALASGAVVPGVPVPGGPASGAVGAGVPGWGVWGGGAGWWGVWGWGGSWCRRRACRCRAAWRLMRWLRACRRRAAWRPL